MLWHETKYAYLKVIGKDSLRRVCGRLRGLGVTGASWCGVPATGHGEFPAFGVRIPAGTHGEPDGRLFASVTADDMIRGSCALVLSGAPRRQRTCWYAVAEYKADVVYCVVQTNLTHSNGDIQFIQPQCFRSMESAINWVKETRIPEVKALFDCQMATTDDASDSPDEHTVHLYLKDKNHKLRVKDGLADEVKIRFDIQRAEVQDDV
jgi:hypothetical protein